MVTPWRRARVRTWRGAPATQPSSGSTKPLAPSLTAPSTSTSANLGTVGVTKLPGPPNSENRPLQTRSVVGSRWSTRNGLSESANSASVSARVVSFAAANSHLWSLHVLVRSALLTLRTLIRYPRGTYLDASKARSRAAVNSRPSVSVLTWSSSSPSRSAAGDGRTHRLRTSSVVSDRERNGSGRRSARCQCLGSSAVAIRCPRVVHLALWHGDGRLRTRRTANSTRCRESLCRM